MKRLLLVAAFVTFSHSGLAQTPNGLRVFDGTGKVIGTYLVAAPCSAMERCRGAVYIGGPTATGIVVPITSKGVALAQMYDGINTVSFFHVSTDCSGPRLLRGRDYGDSSDLMPPPAILSVPNGKLIIPFKPGFTVDLGSIETIQGDIKLADLTQPGACTPTSYPSELVYLMITVDASLIGTPPFSVR